MALFAGPWADFALCSLFHLRVSIIAQLAEEVPHIPGVEVARVEIVADQSDQVGSMQREVDAQWTASAILRTRPRTNVQ